MQIMKLRSVIPRLPAILSAILALSAVIPSYAAPQKTSGVYLTSDAFKEDHLDFEGDCKSNAHKLELHNILNKPYIDVTHHSQKRRYAKSELFGFRACNGRIYRFASDLEYEILEFKQLYIYGHKGYVHSGKGNAAITKYYFSVGPDGELLDLTSGNLKLASPDNQRFHDLLDKNFGPKRKLAEYDPSNKTYVVNLLFAASQH
jgi:hypothetical protein